MATLRNPAEFRRVLEVGRRRPVGGVVVIGATGSGGPPRVGLTVSKSIGNAVTRNRARRRLRHTVREIELQPNTDYVIIARRAVLDAPFDTLVGWVRRAVAELADD